MYIFDFFTTLVFLNKTNGQSWCKSQRRKHLGMEGVQPWHEAETFFRDIRQQIIHLNSGKKSDRQN
jgi:hypothetical protein